MFFGVNEKVHDNKKEGKWEGNSKYKSILMEKEKQHGICIVCERETIREIRIGKW